MFRRRPPLPPFPPGAALVGGAVRDWLRGVRSADYDWAHPDPAAGARALAALVGGAAFPLDEERGYWRVTAGEVQHTSCRCRPTWKTTCADAISPSMPLRCGRGGAWWTRWAGSKT